MPGRGLGSMRIPLRWILVIVNADRGHGAESEWTGVVRLSVEADRVVN